MSSSNDDSDTCDAEQSSQQSEQRQFVAVLEKFPVIFNKSQVPTIKESKDKAWQQIHSEYMLNTGKELTLGQVKKKVQNMKTELKKKTDKRATGNKKIILRNWEKRLLKILEADENPVFKKIPGGKGVGVAMHQNEVATEVTTHKEAHQTQKPRGPPPSKKTRLDEIETEETKKLSTAELQRLVLLEQLKVLRFQAQRESLLLKRLQRGSTDGDDESTIVNVGDKDYRVL